MAGPDAEVPDDSVDAHFHVIGPAEAFPMDSRRSYTPPPASLSRWRTTFGPLGVRRGVLVQPSVYGNDHRALLAALADAHGALVGVASVPAGVDDGTLDALVAAGVRGVRLAHFENGDPRLRGGFVPFDAFEALAPRLRERNLHVELFTDSRLLPAIAPRLGRAGVPVVLDHMGRTPAILGLNHEGMATLKGLLRDGILWVKLSGVANISTQAPRYEDARPIFETLVEAAPSRVFWGSDWPHTTHAARPPDSRALLALTLSWTPKEHRTAVFRDNAAGFYRIPSRVQQR